MQETQVWFLGQEDPLEKEMANYSSILAWTIPGGLQSMELQESVRHDLAAKPPLPPTTMLTSIEPRTWEETSSDHSAISLSLPSPPPLLSTTLLCERSAAAAKSIQSCPTLCDPIDGSPPDSPVPGILQARTLEWVAISFSNAWKWKVKVKTLSLVQLSATPWTAAHQAAPSMGFSRQEYWSGVPLPSPGERSNHFHLPEFLSPSQLRSLEFTWVSSPNTVAWKLSAIVTWDNFWDWYDLIPSFQGSLHCTAWCPISENRGAARPIFLHPSSTDPSSI